MTAGAFRLTRRTWRGVDGWHIGSGPGPFPVSIFFEHESAARRTIGRLRSDPDYRVEVADFEREVAA
jgi:hypothetical protein